VAKIERKHRLRLYLIDTVIEKTFQRSAIVSGPHCDLVEYLFAGNVSCFTLLATCDNLPTIMPEQWKSITGLVELEQPASTEPPKPSTVKYAGQSTGNVVGFAHGLMFGIGATVLALVITLFFNIYTDFGFICYLAPAVGWLVGKAIKKGSYGVGGLRYQVTAIFLTYTAISLAATPYYLFFGSRKYVQQQQMLWLPDASQMRFEDIPIYGSISPFLALYRGILGFIGLAILFVGLYIAYRITAAKRLVAQ
jgi:hypothetical protein